MLIPINEGTEVQINTEYLNQEIIQAKIEQLQLAYIEGISWLAGIPRIIENNDVEKDSANIEELQKQKVNVEKNMADLEFKYLFLTSLQDK